MTFNAVLPGRIWKKSEDIAHTKTGDCEKKQKTVDAEITFNMPSTTYYNLFFQ